MAKDLLEYFKKTDVFFEEASDAISIDLKKLCLDGPDTELALTFNAQPAILTTSYSWFKVLEEELGFCPTMSAGHSLGEYSSLLGSSALTLTEAVKLVRRRGELMQHAVPVGKGKMAAVLGLEDLVLEKLCQAASKPNDLVVPANYNSPGQIVVAGHATAVDRAQILAQGIENPEFKAKRFLALNVSAPFHCPLMTPVAEKFVDDLRSVRWKTPRYRVWANVDALEHQESTIAQKLCAQLDHPVRWTQCTKAMGEAGATHFIEVGPGRVLSGLVKRILEKPSVFGVDNYQDFQTLEKEGLCS